MTGASSQNKREEVATAKTFVAILACDADLRYVAVVAVFVSKCMHNFLTTP